MICLNVFPPNIKGNTFHEGNPAYTELRRFCRQDFKGLGTQQDYGRTNRFRVYRQYRLSVTQNILIRSGNLTLMRIYFWINGDDREHHAAHAGSGEGDTRMSAASVVRLTRFLGLYVLPPRDIPTWPKFVTDQSYPKF